LASAIRIADPVHAPRVAETGAEIVSVSDEEIVSAWRELAAVEGVFSEPSSAASLAAVARGAVSGVVVCTLTGHGLKDAAAAERHAPPPMAVDPDPDAIAEAAR
jgi:threonine synthase